jgi:hypothetical protein
VNRQRMTHEIRSDRAATAPGLYHTFLRRTVIDRSDLLFKVEVYVRTLFN